MKRYTYIIRCHDHYKIGVATNVEKRMMDLQTGNPYPLTLVGKYETNSRTGYLETMLHGSLAKWNTLNEWFTLSEFSIDEIKKVCRAVEIQMANGSTPVVMAEESL